MRKHKSVVAILLAVMMIFTFMPTMAFANDVPVKEFTGVTWASDFHSVDVNTKISSGATVKTDTLHFDYLKDGRVVATEAEYRAYTLKPAENLRYFVKATLKDDKTAEMTLVAGKVVEVTKETYPDEYAAGDKYVWVENPDVTVLAGFTPEIPALTNELKKTVLDASLLPVVTKTAASADKKVHVEAGAYSAWYANKDDKTSTYYDSNPAKVTKVGAWTVGTDDDQFFNVEYPAYDAYEFDTNTAGKKVDKELDIKVTLNEAAIKAYYGANINVSTAEGTIKVVPEVGTPNHPFYNSYYIEDDKAYNKADATSYDNKFTYDGKSHGIVFKNMPKNVTAKYYVTKVADWKAPKKADWVDTFPGIKDAGEYYVAVMFTAEKNNVSYNADGTYTTTVTVNKMPVTIKAKQSDYIVEYGKLSETELEAALKALFVAPTVPDSQDKVDEVVSKYLKLEGLFTQVGHNTVKANLNDTDYKADTELAKAVANYKFQGGTIELNVTTADNNIDVNAPNKTFKAKKSTKKLASNKSFNITATADFGTPSFKKVSGNSKIKVSKSGKVTVKKGLKKGTYKVKVKALVKGTANYVKSVEPATFYVKIK